ncbi:MAG: CYTH domain-containing protein [Planctomycetota bacterium]
MAVEIERKFLVCGDGWKSAEPVLFRQGYLSTDKNRVVRVRIAGDSAWLTVKSLTSMMSRDEFEYPVPVSDADAMLKLCEGPLIEKYRRNIPLANHIWEVDEFFGDNAPLVVAEIELTSEDEVFETPDWVGVEVTDDPRYFNANLCINPYSMWPENVATD